VPAVLSASVLLEPTGADSSRLLMVIHPLMALLSTVVASMVTVLLPALVMRSADSTSDGAWPSNQLPDVSHLLLPSIQTLVGDRTVPLLMMVEKNWRPPLVATIVP